MIPVNRRPHLANNNNNRDPQRREPYASLNPLHATYQWSDSCADSYVPPGSRALPFIDPKLAGALLPQFCVFNTAALDHQVGVVDESCHAIPAHSPTAAPPLKKLRFVGGQSLPPSSTISSLTSSDTDPLPLLPQPALLPYPFIHSPASTSRKCGLGSPGIVEEAVARSFAPEEGSEEGWAEDDLVQVLTSEVEYLCVANEHTTMHKIDELTVPDELKIFYSQYKQPFELDFYIRRLVEYSYCPISAFIVALIYLDRVQTAYTSLSMTEMSCHRLLSTALVLSIKYLDDEVYSNAYYARVSGLTTDELNSLEAAMLNILDWRLSVDPELFSRYEGSLSRHAADVESNFSLMSS